MKYVVCVCMDGHDVSVLEESSLCSVLSAVEALLETLSLFGSGYSVRISVRREGM